MDDRIPAEVCARFEGAEELNDKDRQAITEVARQALAQFQPKPEPKAEARPKPKSKPDESEPKTALKEKS